eukprot:575598-Rhodomonas_salina.2
MSGTSLRDPYAMSGTVLQRPYAKPGTDKGMMVPGAPPSELQPHSDLLWFRRRLTVAPGTDAGYCSTRESGTDGGYAVSTVPFRLRQYGRRLLVVLRLCYAMSSTAVGSTVLVLRQY